MVPLLGDNLLYLSLIICGLIIFYGVFSYLSEKQLSHKILMGLWGVEFVSMLTAFLCLIYCFINSDFSVLNVVYNSHTSKPLLYKISAAWASHEGSMLLWVISLTIFIFLFGLIEKNSDYKFINTTLVIHSALVAGFLSFIILTTNPFVRVFPKPSNGFGLNPILQDIGLAVHPPILYLGYVGFSIVYSLAISGFIHNQINRDWAKIAKKWTLIPWFFLTLGIFLGSWWAYRELGWGGFWFWDPVENASLMPWLLGCSLIHSLTALQKRGVYHEVSYLLSVVTFGMSVMGTFMVRSGLITSVHAFANDPSRGVFILIFMGIIVGFGLFLYSIKDINLNFSSTIYLTSKEGFLYWCNILLWTIVFIILLGTVYPKIVEVFGDREVSIGPPYFNKMVTPFCFLLAASCSLSVFAKWGKPYGKSILIKTILIGYLALILLYFIFEGERVSYVLGALIGGTLLVSQFISKRNTIASAMAHIGFAILIISISFNGFFQQNTEQSIKIGGEIKLANFQLELTNLTLHKDQNYLSRIASVMIKENSKKIAVLYPETRFFPIEKQQTTEAAIFHNLFYDIYIAIGHVSSDNKVMIRAYIMPMIMGIWLGGAIMCSSVIIYLFYKIKRKSRA